MGKKRKQVMGFGFMGENISAYNFHKGIYYFLAPSSSSRHRGQRWCEGEEYACVSVLTGGWIDVGCLQYDSEKEWEKINLEEKNRTLLAWQSGVKKNYANRWNKRDRDCLLIFDSQLHTV